jgi:FkbM family methyltransferase
MSSTRTKKMNPPDMIDFSIMYDKDIEVEYNSNQYIFCKTELQSEQIQIRSCIYEMIYRNDYDLFRFVGAQNATFIDIGANHGVASVVLAKQNPKSMVYAFEPDPKVYQYLLKNIELNGLTNLMAFNKAVCKRGIKTIDLMLNPNFSGGNTTCSDLETHTTYWKKPATYVTVDAICLDEFIEDYRIDSIELLKIDCEGAEFEILQNSPYFKNNIVKNITGEFHELDWLTKINEPIKTSRELREFVSMYVKGMIKIS